MLERGRITEEVPADRFLDRLGTATILHLHMPVGARTAALELLRTHGFRPIHNGVGLLVPVPSAQKAAPLRVLAEARLPVEDFELVSAERAPATEAHP